MASKIRDELIKTSKLEKKRGEDDAAYMTRVHYEIAGKITDAEWNALSGPAQDWNNAAATTIDNKQPLPAFDDETDDAAAATPAPTPARGRRNAGTPGVTPGLPEPFVPKVGAPVIVTTKRGKAVPGIIVELTDDEVVINAKGEAGEKEDDQDFVLSAVTITAAPPVLNAASAAAQAAGGTTGQDAEDEGPMEPQVGDSVQVVTSRDKTIMGNVIELDMEADVLVLKDASGADHELVPSRLKSVEVKHRPNAGKGAAAGMPENKLGVAPAAPVAKGRRGAAAKDAAAAPTAPAGDDDEGGKPTVASVIRETLVNNPAATEAECEAALKKAGVTFSAVTVKVAYKSTQKTVQAMHKKHGLK